MTPHIRITSALGIVQILTWGSSFYLLAVLGPAIAAQTQWSIPAVTAGVSLGLLISGFSAGPVGRLIKSLGGRPVMVGGVLTLAVGLVALSFARSLPIYYIAWAVMGAGMAATLYEAAFSTLGVIFGRDARRAITVLTLWGGFASTICWPLSAWMVEVVGWRGACLGYAAVHLLITAPICAWAIPVKSIEEAPAAKRKRTGSSGA